MTGYSEFYKCYIGDGVYVQYDGVHFVLTAENGYMTTNTIYLDPEVYETFEEYAKRALARHKDLEKGR